MKLEYKDYTLDFTFDAGTSRGVLKSHHIIVLKLTDSRLPAIEGYGEAAPLKGLSQEAIEEVKDFLPQLSEPLQNQQLPETDEDIFDLVDELVPTSLSSLRIGLQTALLDLKNGGRRIIFENDFVRGKIQIPINGLIWMGDMEWMKKQADEKISSGFACIKMKIAAIDFEQELALLRYIREKSPQVILRVDANGGIENNRALAKLSKLEEIELHSIEQPIMPRQPEAMQLICEKSNVPIALDEELIGIHSKQAKIELLDMIKPQFLVLKPTLIGGFKSTMEWIDFAKERNIGWWITSALESNITLNAIAQFAEEVGADGHQGLGTGSLYHNNIESPLTVNKDMLSYDLSKTWDLELL